MRNFLKTGLIYFAVTMSLVLLGLDLVTSYYSIDLWSVLT